MGKSRVVSFFNAMPHRSEKARLRETHMNSDEAQKKHTLVEGRRRELSSRACV